MCTINDHKYIDHIRTYNTGKSNTQPIGLMCRFNTNTFEINTSGEKKKSTA